MGLSPDGQWQVRQDPLVASTGDQGVGLIADIVLLNFNDAPLFITATEGKTDAYR